MRKTTNNLNQGSCNSAKAQIWYLQHTTTTSVAFTSPISFTNQNSAHICFLMHATCFIHLFVPIQMGLLCLDSYKRNENTSVKGICNHQHTDNALPRIRTVIEY